MASQTPADFARLYREHGLEGGHVIKLGPGNDTAAEQALAAWPSENVSDIAVLTELSLFQDGLQIGGGITDVNAKRWIDAGASKARDTDVTLP